MKKTEVVKPLAMTTIFAENVYSSTSTSDFEIPIPTSTSPDDTCVQDDGFLPITSLDLDDGGHAPERKNFNGLFYVSTDLRNYLQNGNLITFSADVAAAIGGYPKDAVLSYLDENGNFSLVQSLIDDNNYNFITNPAYLNDGVHWRAITLDGANKDLSNLTTTGNNRLHALKSYEDAGEVLTDGEGYADVVKYAHSTFDSSKFTVVGTPTITNNGIVSGLSYSNKLQVSTIAYSGQDYKVTLSGKFTGTQSANGNLLELADGTNNIRFYRNANSITCSQTSSTTEYTPQFTFSSDTSEFYIIWEYNASENKYYYECYENGNLLVSNNKTATNKLTGNINVTIGGIYSDINCSIDLKQFSIAVDKLTVFSGNVTSVDTIKPDDYTVVGTPTISADGIASGFSSGNVINAPFTYFSNNVKISCGFYWDGTTSIKSKALYRLPRNQWANVLVGDSLYDHKIRFYLAVGSSATTVKNFEYTLPSQGNYVVDIEFTGTQYIFSVAKDNTLLYTDTYTTTENFYFSSSTSTNLVIGGVNDYGYYPNSIDLNAFKIYVDGNLVYQPCLKIPFTWSKTGSKIVDTAYKSRLDDMYTQFGIAPYYMLQEQKTGDYIVMGTSPIISPDFIVSNFTSNNYLVLPFVYNDNVVNYKEIITFTTGADITTRQPVRGIGQNVNKGIGITVTGGKINYRIGTGSGWQQADSTAIAANTTYKVEFIQTSTATTFKLYNSSGTLLDTKNVTYTSLLYEAIVLGANRIWTSGDNTFSGSIDLKAYKIYINDVLEYEAVLPPYFALPQGEIYGMIRKAGNDYSKPNYATGVSITPPFTAYGGGWIWVNLNNWGDQSDVFCYVDGVQAFRYKLDTTSTSAIQTLVPIQIGQVFSVAETLVGVATAQYRFIRNQGA